MLHPNNPKTFTEYLDKIDYPNFHLFVSDRTCRQEQSRAPIEVAVFRSLPLPRMPVRLSPPDFAPWVSKQHRLVRHVTCVSAAARDAKRAVRSGERDIDKEIRNLERNEKSLVAEIKKTAKGGNQVCVQCVEIVLALFLEDCFVLEDKM